MIVIVGFVASVAFVAQVAGWITVHMILPVLDWFTHGAGLVIAIIAAGFFVTMCAIGQRVQSRERSAASVEDDTEDEDAAA